MKLRTKAVLLVILAAGFVSCSKSRNKPTSGTWKEEEIAEVEEEKVQELEDEPEPEEVVEEETTPVLEEEPDEEPIEDTPVLIDGMRPENKAYIDSYRDFLMEYCDFMEAYDKNPDDLTLLAKYAVMMAKYADIVEKMDESSQEFNDAEMLYLLDTQNEINKRLYTLN